MIARNRNNAPVCLACLGVDERLNFCIVVVVVVVVVAAAAAVVVGGVVCVVVASLLRPSSAQRLF